MMYATIELPESVVKDVDKYIARSTFGYKDREELVKEAIRVFLRERRSK